MDKLYKIDHFKELIKKAKIRRDLKSLNNTHTALLEYLNV